jgi:putative hydrolase of the HAD superfamily
MTMPGVDNAPLAILLDLGGVLIDVSFERALRYWHASATGPARNVPSAGPPAITANHDLAAEMMTDANIDRAYERHERGEIDFPAFAEALDDKLQLNLSEAQWQHGWNAALGEPLPGALALVRNAAEQWPVFLFSNTNATHHAHWSAQQQELLAPMRTVFVSNELGLRKPDPSAYQAVAAKIGVDADRIFFFDDRQQNVDGAQQAGLQAFRCNRPADVAHVLGLGLSRERDALL